MTVKVSVLGIVILIFILHTIITHLLNWMFRESLEEETGALTILSVGLMLMEGGICLGLLTEFIG